MKIFNQKSGLGWLLAAGLLAFSLSSAGAFSAEKPAPNSFSGGEPLGTEKAEFSGCASITFGGGAGSIIVQGMSAPIVMVQVFNASWQQVFNCAGNCSQPTQLIPNLPAGQYYVKASLLNADWTTICTKEEYVQVLPGQSCANVTSGGSIGSNQTICPGGDPAAITNATSPSGGSGALEYVWLSSTAGCPDAGSNMIAGATGQSYDPGPLTQTTWFRRCSRRAGCTDFTIGESNCVQITVDPNNNCGSGQPNCAAVSIAGGSGAITVSGLAAPIVLMQVFNASWSQVFACSGNCQTPTQTISNLPAGTYYVKVDFLTAGWAAICSKDGYVQVTTGGGPTAPVASNDNASTTAGNAVSVSPLGNDNLNGGTFQSLQIAAFPLNGTASVSGSTISYSPNPGFSGNDFFTYRIVASNGTSNAATVAVTVSPAPQNPPTANNDNASTTAGNAVSVSPLGNDNLNGGAFQSLQIATNPLNGTASVSGSTINYSPNPGFSGNDFFTYRIVASNGTSNAATVAVTVSPAPQNPPTANNDNASTTSGNAVSVSPLGNDNLNGGTFQSLQIAAFPFNGSVSISGQNITYTPNANFTGNDFFTYRIVASNGTSNAATVSVNVTAPAPTGVLTVGQPANITVMAGSGQTTMVVNYVVPTGTTTCPGGAVTATRTAGLAAGAAFPIGATTVSYRLSDNCGNIRNVSFTVTVTAFSCNKKIAFFCGNPSVLTAAEAIIKAKLEALGYVLSFFDDNGSHAGLVSGHGCCFISSSCTGSLFGWAKSLVLPIICLKRSLLFDLGMVFEHGSQGYWSWDNEHCNILGGSLGGLFSWLWGGMSSGHHKIFNFGFGSFHDVDWGRPNHGNCAFRTEVPWNSTRCRTFGYAQGVSMTNGFAAPHRRIGLCFGDNKCQFLNDAGWTLLTNAVHWAAECPNTNATTSSSDLFTFAAHRDGLDAKLVWANNSGERNEFFEVERSTDEKTWQVLDQKDGKGDAGDVLYFESRDPLPAVGANFYRIKLTEKGGTFRYSEMQKLDFEGQPGIAAFPNPASDELFVELSKYAGQSVSLELVNVFGQTVRTEKAIDAGQSAHRLDLKGLTEGHYLLQIEAEGRRAETLKIAVGKL